MKKTESVEAILDNSNLLRMDTPKDELKTVNNGSKIGIEDSERENNNNDSLDDEDNKDEMPPPLVIQQVCHTIHHVRYIRLTRSKTPAASVAPPIPTPS